MHNSPNGQLSSAPLIVHTDDEQEEEDEEQLRKKKKINRAELFSISLKALLMISAGSFRSRSAHL